MRIKITGVRNGTLTTTKEGLELYNKHKWYINKEGYLMTNYGGQKLRFHRLLMDAPIGKDVDHINHLKLDNRKENLRICENYENSQNQPKRKGSSSRFYGIYKTPDNQYCCSVCTNNQKIHIGYFDNEMNGAVAYDMYLVKHKLQFKPLNFPENKEKYLKMVDTYQFPDISRSKTSKYIGVYKQKNTFLANIKIKKVCTILLRSNSDIECAKAYDDYIVKNNMPNKKLNFPKDYPNFHPELPIKTFCVIIDENTVKLCFKDNIVNFLNKQDYDKIKYYKSYIDFYGYIILKINRAKIKLSRFIMGVTDPKLCVDHWDSNPLNNRRENLRTGSKSDNGKNLKKSISNKTSSKYIGVSKRIDYTAWSARIVCNRKSIHIGTYKTEEFAARSRDLYVLLKLKNNFYKLNYKWNDEDIEKWKVILNYI